MFGRLLLLRLHQYFVIAGVGDRRDRTARYLIPAVMDAVTIPVMTGPKRHRRLRRCLQPQHGPDGRTGRLPFLGVFVLWSWIFAIGAIVIIGAGPGALGSRAVDLRRPGRIVVHTLPAIFYVRLRERKGARRPGRSRRRSI